MKDKRKKSRNMLIAAVAFVLLVGTTGAYESGAIQTTEFAIRLILCVLAIYATTE